MKEIKAQSAIKNYLVYHNDIYPFSLIVGKMSDANQINQEYKGVDGNDISPHFHSDATTYTVYKKGESGSFICVLFNITPTVKLIAHESLHATYIVMNLLCHVELNDHTDECYAYLIGWFADKIDEYFKFLEKNRDDKKKRNDEERTGTAPLSEVIKNQQEKLKSYV